MFLFAQMAAPGIWTWIQRLRLAQSVVTRSVTKARKSDDDKEAQSAMLMKCYFRASDEA